LVEQKRGEYVIRPATKADLHRVLSWLREEWNGVYGFWGNRDMISEGQKQGDLTVLVRSSDDLLLGFLLGSDRSMAIMAIKPEFRRQGLGRSLAESGLRRVEAAGRFGLIIECEPKMSVPFWEGLGFRHVDRPSGRDCYYYAFLTFPKRFSLPSEAATASIHVELSTEYCWIQRPPELFDRRAAWVDQSKLALETRIVDFTDSADTVVRIHVDGGLVWDRKVKYSNVVGVEYKDNFVRIDHVICPEPSA